MKQKKIVVVEDDCDLLFLLEKLFEKEGYKVVCLPDWSAVVNNANFEWPDLFLLDKEMVFIDGISICHYLKSNPKTENIPIIMMSGTSQFEAKAYQAGVKYFLEKPVDINKIFQVVHSLL